MESRSAELKQGVVGGLMLVRCREVGQRLPESLTSGFMMKRSQDKRCLMSQCLSPHLERFPLILICMFSFPSCHRRSEDWERDEEGELTLYPPARTQFDGATSLPPNGESFSTLRVPSAGSVGRDSWCCESGRHSQGTGYFPTPGSHHHP